MWSMKITFSPNVSVVTLRKAVALAESIEQKQAELQSLLTGQTVASRGRPSVKKYARGKRKFSPEQRAKISEGLKAKWAARKALAAASSTPSSTAAPTTA